MFKCKDGELLPAKVSTAQLVTTDNGSPARIITDEELLVIQQMASGLNMLKSDLDLAASRAEDLLETDYNLENKEDYRKFVENFGKGCPLAKAITGIDSKRKELNRLSTALINAKIEKVLGEVTLLLQKGARIRREYDEKVAAAEAAKRAEETARVERINAEMERMSARTNVLVRLPGNMIGKNSEAIKAAIIEASEDFQLQGEEFFCEFLPAAQERKAALAQETETCLNSLQTLLTSAEADEKAKAEREESERIEDERKKAADLAIEKEMARQKLELEEASAISEIALLSLRLVNSAPAEIKDGIARISTLTGSQKLMDAVSAADSALRAALEVAERREEEEKEKAEAARLKAAEEERAKHEEDAEKKEAEREKAAKKDAEESEAKREAEERQDADLEETINSLLDFTDRDTAEKLLQAVLLNEIPHLRWSNKC